MFTVLKKSIIISVSSWKNNYFHTDLNKSTKFDFKNANKMSVSLFRAKRGSKTAIIFVLFVCFILLKLGVLYGLPKIVRKTFLSSK